MSELEDIADDPLKQNQKSLVVYKESFIKTLFNRIKYLLKLIPKQSYLEKEN